jgi:hypothetical protein
MAIGALAAEIAVAWACSDGAVTVNWGLMDCSGVLVAGGSCVPGAVGLDDIQLFFLGGVVLCRPGGSELVGQGHGRAGKVFR